MAPSLKLDIRTTRPAVHESKILVAAFVLGAITAIGTFGFMWIEDLSLVDALYMAVITLSTVGYQEVAPPSTAGRVFTVAYIVVGVGASVYTVAAVAEFFIEGRLRETLGRRSMERAIQAMRNHVIVCGYGRLGRAVAESLRPSKVDVVVVEQNEAMGEVLDEAEFAHVIGSAVEESVLRRAGIEHARAVVTATPSDPDNVYIALSAREINPEIAIHSRGETEQGIRRMRLAGAQQVISLHGLGGQRIANAILRPAVVDFLELSRPGADAPIDLEEVIVGSGSRLDGVEVGQIASLGARLQVVAIKRLGQDTHLNPAPDHPLAARDHVVVVGDHDNLGHLAALAEARPEP
ncbi:MAG: potassium channel family protein [Myxococcota bacterium]